MSGQPVTFAVLARFHREVILPDVERVVGALFEQRLLPRLDAIDAHFDTIYQRFDHLETEYEAIKAGLGRVEERLDRVEHRLDGLEAQHGDLIAAVRRLDERLSRVEKRLDELLDAQREYTLRSEVQELRQQLHGLQARVDAIEKRPER